MREIKFRAWDKKRNKMATVDSVHFNVNGLDTLVSITTDEALVIEGVSIGVPKYLNTEVELMQYTNLQDQNGVKIFEGDIVNFVIFDHNGRDTHYTGVVKFAQGCYQIWKTVESEYYGSDGAFVLGWIGEDEIEVVGNVFENAELLEVE